MSKWLTIIGRGWAKYHDFSVESSSILLSAKAER